MEDKKWKHFFWKRTHRPGFEKDDDYPWMPAKSLWEALRRTDFLIHRDSVIVRSETPMLHEGKSFLHDAVGIKDYGRQQYHCGDGWKDSLGDVLKFFRKDKNPVPPAPYEWCSPLGTKSEDSVTCKFHYGTRKTEDGELSNNDTWKPAKSLGCALSDLCYFKRGGVIMRSILPVIKNKRSLYNALGIDVIQDEHVLISFNYGDGWKSSMDDMQGFIRNRRARMKVIDGLYETDDVLRKELDEWRQKLRKIEKDMSVASKVCVTERTIYNLNECRKDVESKIRSMERFIRWSDDLNKSRTREGGLCGTDRETLRLKVDRLGADIADMRLRLDHIRADVDDLD